MSFSDLYLDPKPTTESYQKLMNAREYVLVGSLNRTLLSLIRLEQRKGKKLILVSFPELEPFHRFADEIYPDLRQVTAAEGRLFIYNQNRIPETLAASIWNLAGADNVMHTTDYMNHSGFLAMHPHPVKFSAVDFAISFGSAPAAKADFKVASMPLSARW